MKPCGRRGCNRTFISDKKHPWQRYCSAYCRVTAHRRKKQVHR